MKRRDVHRALLDAAADEFARLGRDGARIEAIVGRAGVNVRMIYHHFGSKEGLYRAVLEDHWRSMAAGAATLERFVEHAPAEGLELAMRALHQSVMERPLMLPLIFQEAMSGWRSAPSATIAQIPPALRTLYERGQREGVFRADCPFETVYLAALGALASIHILAPRFEDLRGRSQADRLAAQTLDLVLRGALR